MLNETCNAKFKVSLLRVCVSKPSIASYHLSLLLNCCKQYPCRKNLSSSHAVFSVKTLSFTSQAKLFHEVLKSTNMEIKAETQNLMPTRFLFSCLYIMHLSSSTIESSNVIQKVDLLLFLWGVQKPFSKFPKVFERLWQIILDVQIHKICPKKRKVIFEVFARCALTDQKFQFFCVFFLAAWRGDHAM